MNNKIRAAAAVAALAVIGVACDNDRGARKDLPNQSQNLDEGSADIILMPDAFPNLAHKCYPLPADFPNAEPVGMWTTSDRGVWIVYGDPLCGGTSDPFILDNIPGGSVAEGSGDDEAEGEG